MSESISQFECVQKLLAANAAENTPPVRSMDDIASVTILDFSMIDFEPEYLDALCLFHNLKSLAICIHAEDLSFLSSFPQLEDLDLVCWNKRNCVDFKYFACLKELSYLYVSGGDISSIAYRNLDALTELKHLQYLSLHEFGEVDLAPLAKMPWIESFFCGYADRVVHPEAIGQISGLKELVLIDFEVDNLDFLDQLDSDLSLDLCAIRSKDIYRPEQLTRFRNVDISESTFADQEWEINLTIE